ncbi:hypothetical protein [Salegentibacter flavus]|uniref:Uncharacterized protein n=1 Tax=Salegentibacter flavus TaxID=287099 RepID=A0A1I4YMM1_9FLAO|nr:hypothetical protein [Salegentibacter flavus]SFN39298.1 hypothetical protein SAMN05660413_00860 [Salegentibacter flavus]
MKNSLTLVSFLLFCFLLHETPSFAYQKQDSTVVESELPPEEKIDEPESSNYILLAIVIPR